MAAKGSRSRRHRLPSAFSYVGGRVGSTGVFSKDRSVRGCCDVEMERADLFSVKDAGLSLSD